MKFEEDIEEGGEKWSKPHVASLSLHSLFDLRVCMVKGTVLLDLAAHNLEQISGIETFITINNNNNGWDPNIILIMDNGWDPNIILIIDNGWDPNIILIMDNGWDPNIILIIDNGWDPNIILIMDNGVGP